MATQAYSPPSVPVAAGPGVHATAVVPSDTTIYNPPLRLLWIGTAGSGGLAIQAVGDTTAVTLAGVGVGQFNACVIQKVLATGTNVSAIIGFW